VVKFLTLTVICGVLMNCEIKNNTNSGARRIRDGTSIPGYPCFGTGVDIKGPVGGMTRIEDGAKIGG